MACSTSRLRRAYPRGRGGAVAMVRMGRMPSGLSPRTRGSPIIPIVAIIALGPIPADAGEPECGLADVAGVGAYPRGRGGARWASQGSQPVRGLSPRTRGSLQRQRRRHHRQGPIPADAGEPEYRRMDVLQ